MYPTISHLIYDLFGLHISLPIQTFGFWVAMAFIGAGWIISKELKRKEKEGLLYSFKTKEIVGKKLSAKELIINLFIGFAIGFKGFYCLINWNAFSMNPQGFILSSKGEAWAGILTAIIFTYLKWKENKKTRLKISKEIEKTTHPYELTGNMILIAAISGIIGAKIFHNLENIDLFLSNPIEQLISFSGLTFYGGLIAGATSVIWYAKKYNINIKHLIDSFAPALILAYGIGRIGCQMAGDGCWGIENLAKKPTWMHFLPEWMWSYTFPHNAIHAGKTIELCNESAWAPYCSELVNPVWPTAFYETIISFIIFTILWKIRKKIKISGVLFFIYLSFNGIERFFIEKIRVNNKYEIFGGITQAEIISLCLFITGVIGVIYLINNKNRSPLN